VLRRTSSEPTAAASHSCGPACLDGDSWRDDGGGDRGGRGGGGWSVVRNRTYHLEKGGEPKAWSRWSRAQEFSRGHKRRETPTARPWCFPWTQLELPHTRHDMTSKLTDDRAWSQDRGQPAREMTEATWQKNKYWPCRQNGRGKTPWCTFTISGTSQAHVCIGQKRKHSNRC